MTSRPRNISKVNGKIIKKEILPPQFLLRDPLHFIIKQTFPGIPNSVSGEMANPNGGGKEAREKGFRSTILAQLSYVFR